MVCQQEEEEEEKKKKDWDSWVWREKGRFFFFFSLLIFRQEMECLVGRDGGVGKVAKIGIDGNMERIQIKTIVHLEGKDG